MPCWHSSASDVVWHIPHEYGEEQAKKSSVVSFCIESTYAVSHCFKLLYPFAIKVPLGVLMYNENRLDEMCKILEHLHQSVPSVSTSTTIELPNGAEFQHNDVLQTKATSVRGPVDFSKGAWSSAHPQQS